MDRPGREQWDRWGRDDERGPERERWERERGGRDDERRFGRRDDDRWFERGRERDEPERHPGAREAWRAVDRGDQRGPSREQWSRGYEQRWPGDAPWQTEGAHARQFEQRGRERGREDERDRYQDWGRLGWADLPEWQGRGEPHRETRPSLGEAYGSDDRSANGPSFSQGTGAGFGRHESYHPDPNVFNQSGAGTGRRPAPRQESRGRFAGVGPKNYRRSDERLYEDICERLSMHPEIDPSEIEVRVHEAEVTLSGTVDSRGAKHLAEDLCDGVPGVRDVHNELHVTAAGEAEARRGNG